MKKVILLLMLFMVGVLAEANAQFLKPFNGISKKKPTYVTMEDGSKLEGTVDKLKRHKKGLIKEVKLKIDGDKVEIDLEKIDHAYLPQTAFDKLLKIDDMMTDVTQWDESGYENERLKDGYAFFEKIDIEIKGEERKLLMQLLNPFPNNRIKVYHDPQASDDGGMRLGGLKVQKSKLSNYYISKDGAMAHRLRNKDYKDMFDEIFGDCPAVVEEYGKKKRWSNFEDVITLYNESCKN